MYIVSKATYVRTYVCIITCLLATKLQTFAYIFKLPTYSFKFKLREQLQTRKCTRVKDTCEDHSRGALASKRYMQGALTSAQDHLQLSHAGVTHSRITHEEDVASGWYHIN